MAWGTRFAAGWARVQALRPWVRRHRRLLRAGWLAALAVLAIGSLVPGPGLGIGVNRIDKLIHFAGYALAGMLAALAWPRRARLVIALAVGLAVGAGMELIQIPIPRRSGEWLDLAANIAGLAAGATAVEEVRRALRRDRA